MAEYIEHPLAHLNDEEKSRRIDFIAVPAEATTEARLEYIVVDEKNVRVWQHSPQFAGDNRYFDVEDKDGSVVTYFDVERVKYRGLTDEEKAELLRWREEQAEMERRTAEAFRAAFRK